MDNGLINLSTSILELPDDCLYFIFQRLDSSSDRESFGLTCQRWLHIQNSSRRSLQFQCSLNQLNDDSLSQHPTDISLSHLYRLLNRFQQLQSLSLYGCTELSDSGLSMLLSYGLKLQSLNLDCCFSITDHGLSDVAKGCTFLKIISLSRCNITDVGLETLSEFCSALKDVNLSYCLHISDNGIRALSQNCRRLRAICISHCKFITGIGFQGCPQTLAYLEADSCNLEPEGMSAITSGGGLQYLNISNLSWCIRGHGLGAIDARSISKLRVLNFRLCGTIGDDVIIKIAQGCPLLEEWNLARCHEIRIRGWESIASNCRNLKTLHVNYCQNLCEQSLQALRYGCKRLRKLYVFQCPRVTAMHIAVFRYFRKRLRVLHREIMCIAPDWAFQL